MSFILASGTIGRMIRAEIVQAGEVALCVERFGDPADPAILLVHGAGNSMLSWDEELCGRLAAGGRTSSATTFGTPAVRSPTRRARPGGYADHAEDAAALLDVLGVERAHVVGMSLGGGIGQLLALDHPKRVSALTLASSTPGGPGHPASDLPGPSEDLDEPPEPDWSDRDAVVEYLVEAERPFAARSRRYDEDGMRRLMRRVVEHSANIEGPDRLGVLRARRPVAGTARLAEAPTLVVHGTEDPLFPYEHAEALAREIPGAELLPLGRRDTSTSAAHLGRRGPRDPQPLARRSAFAWAASTQISQRPEQDSRAPRKR